MKDIFEDSLDDKIIPSPLVPVVWIEGHLSQRLLSSRSSLNIGENIVWNDEISWNSLFYDTPGQGVGILRFLNFKFQKSIHKFENWYKILLLKSSAFFQKYGTKISSLSWSVPWPQFCTRYITIVHTWLEV